MEIGPLSVEAHPTEAEATIVDATTAAHGHALLR